MRERPRGRGGLAPVIETPALHLSGVVDRAAGVRAELHVAEHAGGWCLPAAPALDRGVRRPDATRELPRDGDVVERNVRRFVDGPARDRPVRGAGAPVLLGEVDLYERP